MPRHPRPAAARSRTPRALGAAASVALLATLTACAGAPPVTPDQFRTLVSAGSFAGVAVSVAQAPAAPSIDVEQQTASYVGAATCRDYWQLAHDKQTSVAGLNATDPATGFVKSIEVELWASAGDAETSVKRWADCLTEYQGKATVQYPLRLAERSKGAGVTWEFWANNDVATPIQTLTLRARNVVAILRLPGDGLDAGWRDSVAQAFADDLAKVAP